MNRNDDFLQSIIENMTLEELCGQVLCYDFYENDLDNIEAEFEQLKPGAIFTNSMSSKEKLKEITDLANKYSVTPVIVACDVENGPCDVVGKNVHLPHSMAWGACDDEKLIEEAGEVTARICKHNGVQWTFSPIVDININHNNPVVNIRAVSDSAAQVVKIAGAYGRGMQKGGMAIALKHFPGDGVDDRNQHFCTTVNSLSKDEWDNSFGKVYEDMVDADSVMVAHIALPCYDNDYDKIFGYKPATLSYKLTTNLLKEKLKFDGCVVSDAMSMLGSVTRVEKNKLAVEFLKIGGDMILFPEIDDNQNIQNAIKSGELAIERLKDAVKRVLIMKQKVGLFDTFEQVDTFEADCARLKEIANIIAEKSLKIVRNFDNVLPLKLKENANILIINLIQPLNILPSEDRSLDVFENELKRLGYNTKTLVNPKHHLVNDIMNDYDCVLINCKMSSRDYHGGSLRIGWNSIMAFWRGYILQHKNVVFTSFGDPYKLYELPFLKTYINAFSNSEASQIAVIKLILGEIPECGKNPVELEGFFEREV